MTRKKLDDLKSEFDAKLADNDVGAISAKDTRDALTNTADSIIPIMASGTDVYFKNRTMGEGTKIYFLPSGNLSAYQPFGSIIGQWATGKSVAAIKFISGADTTNGDDGLIGFYTAASGTPLPSGATWPKTLHKRAQFKQDGRLEIIGSGVGHVGVHYNRVHHSGLGILLDNKYGNHLASPFHQTMGLGRWDDTNNVFSPILFLHGSGDVIISRDGGASSTTLGWAELHIENRNNQSATNNNSTGTGSRIVFKGYKDPALVNSQNIYTLGTDIRSSETSTEIKNNFFIQDLYAPSQPYRMFIDASGNTGFGSVAPSGKVHIIAGGLRGGVSGVALSLGTTESNTYFNWKLSKPGTETNNTYLTLDAKYPAKRNIMSVQVNSTRTSAHVGFGVRNPRGLVEISHSSVADSGLLLTNTGQGGRPYRFLSTHGLSTAIENVTTKSSGCYVIQDLTASKTRFAIDSSGNIGIGEIPQTIKGTATKAMVFGDNGQNARCTSLNTAGLFAKNVGSCVKLYAFDEDDNVTAISPHVFKLFDPPDEMSWSYYGINERVGKEINVDIYGAIQAIEELTGKQFIFTQDI